MKKIFDRISKILICLILVFCLIFVQPKKHVEAAIPALLIPVIGAIVSDVAIDMGIDFVDKAAEKAWKDKAAGRIWNKFGDQIKKLKPTKKNAGKWALNLGKGLLAAIVDEIGDSAEEIIEKDKKRESDNKKLQNKLELSDTDPLYNTGVSITVASPNTVPSTLKATSLLTTMFDFQLKPVAFNQKSEFKICGTISKNTCWSYSFYGGAEVQLFSSYYNASNIQIDFIEGGRQSNGNYAGVSSEITLFNKRIAKIENDNTISYFADGVVVTAGHQNVLRLPDGISSDVLEEIDNSKLPTNYQNGKEFEFDFSDTDNENLLTINEGDDFEWEIIQNDITNKYDSDTLKTTTNNYNYDVDIVYNNYYEVTDDEQEKISNEIEIVINNDNDLITKPDLDGGSSDGMYYCVDKDSKEVVSCKEIEKPDGSLLDMAKNAYTFATGTIKAGVDGLKSVAETGDEISELFEKVFGWLPSEIKYLIVGSFSFVTGLAIWRAFRR